MSATISTILEKAKDLISNPEHWTRNAFARTNSNCVVSPVSSEACKWCALGAIWKSCNQFPGTIQCAGYLDPEHFTAVLDSHFKISIINDQKGHKEVIKLLDELISKFKN